MKTFKEAWKEKEAEGYHYGRDALEGVKFGWEIHVQHAKVECDALKAENARLVAEHEGFDVIHAYTAKLEAERDAAKVDAERADDFLAEIIDKRESTIKERLGAVGEENERLRYELAAAKVDAERLAWLHKTNKTSDGYEWGVAAVKFNEHGAPVSVLWGASDHSDIDAARKAK